VGATETCKGDILTLKNRIENCYIILNSLYIKDTVDAFRNGTSLTLQP